jgi:hypothetical protein
MGWAAGLRSGGGRIRAVALLIATAALALAFTAEVTVYAAYDGIRQRSAARGLEYGVGAGQQGKEVVAQAFDGFDTLDGLQFSVVYIRPASTDSPLPPGVAKWPAPGESVLSPALRTALRAQGQPDRYGTVVATIDDAGLAGPGERYGYVNPTDAQFPGTKAMDVVGFGLDAPSASGDWIFIAPRERLLTGLYLLLLPALLLAVVAARTGSRGRDRRTELVSALGGGLRARTWLNVGESALPVLAGALLGTLPALLVAATGNVRLPWIGYVLSATDLRSRWYALVAAGAVAALALLVLVCLLHRTANRTRATSTRLAARKGQLIRWAAFACPLLVLATVWVPGLLDVTEHASLRATLYTTGVAAVMATLPCAVAVVASALGDTLARSTRRTGSGGALVAGRHIAANPGVTARLVAGIGIAMLLVSQLQLKNTQYGATAQAAAETRQRIGSTILHMEIDRESVTSARLEAVLGQLPAGIATIAVQHIGSLDGGRPPVTRFQGSCASLKALRLSCPATADATTTLPVSAAKEPLRSTLPWVGASPVLTDFEVRRGSALPTEAAGTTRPAGTARQAEESGPTEEAASVSVLLVSSDGKDLPEAAIQKLVRDNVPVGSVEVGAFGDIWLSGANLSAAHGRWVIFLGVPGVLLLALAAALANLGEFIAFSRTVAPLTVLTGRRPVFWSISAWTLLAPLLAAIGLGWMAAVWLAWPQEDPLTGIELSTGMLTGTASGLAMLSLLTWWWGARSALAETKRWRPFGE